jgi:poly(3-hydroxybutyrate) depolymerase
MLFLHPGNRFLDWCVKVGYRVKVFHLEQFVFLGASGRGTHVLAVCQPVVAVLAAAALMAEDHDPAQPRSLALLAGPVDTRISPTEVNRLARSQPVEWFARHLISTVPLRYAGAGRRVYPGALQLAAFMSMNPDRHRDAFAAQYRSLVEGDAAAAAARRRFYEEYFAVMDLPAEFYLDTVRKVFQDHDLARGRLTVAGRPVRPAALRRTALLTVEGERDDICGLGQTMAALDLCPGVRPSMKRHHVQTGVGHYGVFNGRRWASGIYPRVRAMVQARDSA